MDTIDKTYSCKAAAYEASEDVGRNGSTAPTIGDVINARLGRRDMLRGALAVGAVTAFMGPVLTAGTAKAQQTRYVFDEIEHGVDETHHVAPGYDAQVLLRWGDPILPGAPAFDPMNQTAAAQAQQFGYNNDYIGYVPLPAGSNSATHGLLCVNHEYTNEEVMLPGVAKQDDSYADMTEELVNIEMAAHGGSIVEVEMVDGAWTYKQDSAYNRRITAETPMRLSGPAAGHDLLKTAADPSGTEVLGTINNCAGGITPWGTYLMAEENFHGYFWGDMPENHANYEQFARYGVPGAWYAWGRFHDRFDVTKEPNEANRFGWVVEVDPLDPNSTPVKRTAMGRFKHEGAESIVNSDGRVVVYMGDDERFEYLYKFVTNGTFNADDPAANADLLDDGTLYVARFDETGVDWLPLVHGRNGLTEENGFSDQGDVLVRTRMAADLLGATPMDRPEDVEPSRATNNVYVMLTNNSRRQSDQVDFANPRAENLFGHILELVPPGGDHGAERYEWNILVQCGDPSVDEVGALWNPETTENGWFAAPDNCAVDSRGRLWISTDQGSGWARTGTADGIWGLETEGDLRGTGKMFFRVPLGAEMCGPVFTPDDTTLFVAVQH
ncbi:MAG: DUF839 domain-containing protein, partial [Alphaproteobacteria bacterium]|nr:DUF839 domain-containing protein [Alphaproteobacteria bacterium]